MEIRREQMNMKFPFSEESKVMPIQADIILLLLLFPVSSVQILKEGKSPLFTQDRGRLPWPEPCQALIKASSFVVDL